MERKKYIKGKHIRTDWGHGVKEMRKIKEAPATPRPQAPAVQIEMDEATAQGKYANLASISHGETEFIFDFLFLPQAQPKARVHTRIISSPGHTKRFLAALADNVKKYEERFGPIPLHDPHTPSA